MKENKERTGNTKRAAVKRPKQPLREDSFTPEELHELRRVAGDILDRKRY